MINRQPKLAYILNGFDRGGAELSLPGLVHNGLFAGFDLTVVALIRGQGDLQKELATEGVLPIVLVEDKRMSLKGLAIAAILLFRFLRRSRPDIIILSLPQANILGRIAASLLGGFKVISFEHNTVLAKPIYETLFSLTAGALDAIFVDSPQTGIEVTQKFYASKNIPRFVIPLKYFPAPPLLRPVVSRTRPRIVTVGRLAHQKNQSLLIEAIGNLRRTGLEIEVEIIGEGSIHDDLASCAQKNGVFDLVSFPGFIPQWWERDRYEAFVLTSLHEGLCIVALEAMWAGIPLIATQVGGLQDYGNLENMLALPDMPTPAQVADAIRRVVTDPQLAGTIAKAGRATIEMRFSEDAAKQAYADVNAAIRKMAP